jgi:hypothetical protein
MISRIESYTPVAPRKPGPPLARLTGRSVPVSCCSDVQEKRRILISQHFLKAPSRPQNRVVTLSSVGDSSVPGVLRRHPESRGVFHSPFVGACQGEVRKPP